MSAVKVLIVDDSPVIREQMLKILREDPEIEVLGIADGKDNAAEKIAALKPDVITLNLKSKQNFTEFIKAITSKSSLPVVVVTETEMKNPGDVRAETLAFVKMPLIRTRSTMEGFAQRLVQQIKEIGRTKPASAPAPPKPPVKVASAPFEPAKTEAPKPDPKPQEAPEPAAKAETKLPFVPQSKPALALQPKPAPAPQPKPAPAASKPAEPSAEAGTKPKAVTPKAEPIPAPKPAEAAKPNLTDQNDPAARALAAATTAIQKLGSPTPRGRRHVIALGASTGGTDALHEVLHNLPPDTPGIVIVQHMPELFTKMYADRLNRACKMSCVEAVDGERVEVGKIILAAGNYHLRLARDSRGYYVTSQRGEKVSGHCPSVDVLFESVAKVAGSDAIGAIFTGMGADGAIGLKKMRDAGAFTIGQDEKTCVVYGMPMVAYNMGGVCKQAPLDQIANIILENC